MSRKKTSAAANDGPSGVARRKRTGRGRALSALLVFVAAVAGAGVWFFQGRDAAAPLARNAVVIVLDSVRADRLGCYANREGATPHIDTFAQQAVRFANAYAHAPWTLPSVASLFTSQYPVQHGAGGRLGSFTVLDNRSLTMAEIFRQGGLRTGAITNVLLLTDRFGMTQGFDTVSANHGNDNEVTRRAGPTTDVALGWLEEHNRDRPTEPFFLFVHYFDPHLTYDPPQPFRRQFADSLDAEGNDYLFGTTQQIIDFRYGAPVLDPALVPRLARLQYGEIAYLDQEVGRLLTGLSRLGLDENTVVVLTADHGEEFLDHGGFEHGHTLYDELLRVPLLVRLPSTARTASAATATPVDSPVTVRHIDVLPTLCDLLGLPTESSFAGESLLPLLQGANEPDRPVLSQGNMWGPPGSAWRNGGFKLIRQAGPSGQIYDLLYDVRTDPDEQRNLAPTARDRLQKMADDHGGMLESLTRSRRTGDAPALSDQEIQRLRSLGYIK